MSKGNRISKASSPRRKRRTTSALVDLIITAANKEFGNLGYSGATTAAIARQAEVTEAQIFRLFGSKEQLFRAAIFNPLNQHFSEFVASAVSDAAESESVRNSANDYIASLQDFMEKNSRMLMSMIVASAYSPISNQQVGEMDGLQAYFDRGAEMMARRIGPDAKVSPQLMVRVSFAAVLANMMFKDWLFPKDTSQAEIRAAIADFVIGGIQIDEAKAS